MKERQGSIDVLLSLLKDIVVCFLLVMVVVMMIFVDPIPLLLDTIESIILNNKW